MASAGLGLKTFSAHSTRSAATSAVIKGGATIDEVMKHVGRVQTSEQ